MKITDYNPLDKVFNLNKVNECLDLFGIEMGSKIRIKSRYKRKTSAS